MRTHYRAFTGAGCTCGRRPDVCGSPRPLRAAFAVRRLLRRPSIVAADCRRRSRESARAVRERASPALHRAVGEISGRGGTGGRGAVRVGSRGVVVYTPCLTARGLTGEGVASQGLLPQCGDKPNPCRTRRQTGPIRLHPARDGRLSCSERSPLPWLRAVVAEDPAGRPIVGKQCEADGCGRALFDRSHAAVLIQVRCGEARIR